MELYKRIRHRREELGMSQEELAKKIGYKSRSSINKIEMGENDIPQSKIVAFANALDTTPTYLMGWEDEDDDDNIWGVGIFPEEIDEYVHRVGEFLYYNPNHRPLFDSIMEVKTEDIEFAKQMLDRINGKYHENDIYLNAAHERTDIEVTDEMKQHDVGIMDDDNF